MEQNCPSMIVEAMGTSLKLEVALRVGWCRGGSLFRRRVNVVQAVFSYVSYFRRGESLFGRALGYKWFSGQKGWRCKIILFQWRRGTLSGRWV